MEFLLNKRLFLTRIISKVLGSILLKVYRLDHSKVIFFGIPRMYLIKGSRILFGDNVSLISKEYANPVGLIRPVTFRTLSETSYISIGDNTGLSGTLICCQQKIEIGKNVLVGANVTICDTDLHPIAKENRRFSKENIKVIPINIEDNVWIGMNSVILKGTVIGENSIIGAGSIVSGIIPPNCIAAGNPAKIIKYI